MIKHFIFICFSAVLFGQNHGIWVTRFALKNEKTLKNLVTFSIENNITDVFLQVRGRSDAYYLSEVENNIKVNNDKLLVNVIAELKANNIKVHAWINVFLLASTQDNIDREDGHILKKNPNWIDFKNDLISFSNSLETTDDLKQNRNLEGIYTLPIFNDVLNYYKAITKELIHNYDFDGIHLDYFRLAGKHYGFHPKMRRLFHEENDIYIEKYIDETAIDMSVQEKWSEFISSKYSHFLSELTKTNSDVLWSVAVKPNPFDAKYTYGQDWISWLKTGIVDFVMPMNYSKSDNRFASNIKYYQDEDLKSKIWVGIATYNQNMASVISKINIVKQKNMNFTLFSFNDLDEKSIKKIIP